MFRCTVSALLAPLTIFCLTNLAPAAADSAPQYNPNFHYFIAGQLIGPREFVLGDPKNWHTPLSTLSGRSAMGKVKAEADKVQYLGDAIKVTWSKKNVTGQLALYGSPINLAAVKDHAALVFDFKVEKKPKGRVTVAMDCEWPCRGTFYIEDFLKKAPVNEWLNFPIPLSCFRGDRFDLSKINGVFLISTEGAMTLSLANIRVERMPADMQGCKE